MVRTCILTLALLLLPYALGGCGREEPADTPDDFGASDHGLPEGRDSGVDDTDAPEAAGVSDAELSERRGALVDEIVFTQEGDVGKVIGLIERGAQQIYSQGITNISAYNRLRNSPTADYETAYGSSAELTLNPVGPELEDGSLNPFADRRIREAMNWLIDRRHVAEEIYGGMATPRPLPLNTVFPDYARLAETVRALERRYSHNPDQARRVIGERMEALGAERRNGRWFYDGSHVTLRLVIRTDDERHQVGDYVANLLEDSGFRIQRIYRSPEEASRIVIAGNPAGGRWHVYTGGWISTRVLRDLSDNFSFYYTSRGRAEPLWQAYEPDEELDEISERLDRRDYRTLDERLELMARATELAMKESYRIWLVDQIGAIPRSSEVSVATDLAGGLSGSSIWPYTLRYDGRVGGRMVIAAPSLLTEPWNPVAGSNWVFDTMIQRGLGDAPLIPDPFTGLYRPQRIVEAEVTVERGLPVGRTLDWLRLEEADEITVPEDAYIGWDGETGRFRTVGEVYPEGVSARSRTRIRYEDDYFARRWHDGTEVSIADVVLPWALHFARADEDSPLFDRSHVPFFRVFEQYFRGWRIVSEDPLIIEVFSDQIFPDAETIVAASAMSAAPWHVRALGILAETSGELAFSSDKADRQRIVWMSMVSGPSLSVLNRHLEQAIDEQYLPFPEVMKDLVDEREVRRRYQALSDWYAQRNHFWVGDGPFYLHSVHPVERTVVLRRYDDFPDPADKWMGFARAPIPRPTMDGPRLVTPDAEASFTLDITLDGQPHPPEDIRSVSYLIFDGHDELRATGEADYRGDGRWTVTLSAETIEQLGFGANSLEVAITSDRVGMPAFASHAFATLPAGALMPEDD